jgi:phage head maturation protease
MSFGYVVTDSFMRSDGVRVLTAIDLYEATLTTTPANPDTRVLAVKALDTEAGRIRKQARDQMLALLGVTDGAAKSRARGRESAGPVRIASFEC